MKLSKSRTKLGVEEKLFKSGAVAGSTVIIGLGNGVIFDWEPTLTSTAELVTAPRGTDSRLDDNPRMTSNKRRETYLERMDAKAAARAELQAERTAGMWNVDDEIAIARENGSDTTDRD